MVAEPVWSAGPAVAVQLSAASVVAAAVAAAAESVAVVVPVVPGWQLEPPEVMLLSESAEVRLLPEVRSDHLLSPCYRSAFAWNLQSRYLCSGLCEIQGGFNFILYSYKNNQN